MKPINMAEADRLGNNQHSRPDQIREELEYLDQLRQEINGWKCFDNERRARETELSMTTSSESLSRS